MYQRAIKIWEKALGSEHPKLGLSRHFHKYGHVIT